MGERRTVGHNCYIDLRGDFPLYISVYDFYTIVKSTRRSIPYSFVRSLRFTDLNPTNCGRDMGVEIVQCHSYALLYWDNLCGVRELWGLDMCMRYGTRGDWNIL